MTTAVLDASAVIALLKGERGAAKVASVISDAAIGAVNLAEVVGHYVYLGAPLEEIRAMLAALPIAVIACDDRLSWEAGALRAITSAAELSLGDRFCLALAKSMSAPAYTADRAWKEAASQVNVKVVLIR